MRVELSQSRQEQQEYLRNVELARVLEKRVAAKAEKGEIFELKKRKGRDERPREERKRAKVIDSVDNSVLASVF